MRYLSLFLTAVMLSLATACDSGDKYVNISGFTQGVDFNVKFNTKALKISPEKAVHCVDSILKCIDTTLSGFNPGSLISRYNRGEKIEPNWLLKDIYSRAQEMYAFTDHTVDVASAPLFDLWGFGFTGETKVAPRDEEVSELMTVCGLNNFSGNLSQATPGQKLNFNAIAQGYSCDLIAGFLYSIGATDMLVDIGEIYVDGKNPSGKDWKIAIDSPIDGNNEPGKYVQGYWHSDGKAHGIVTSGNYRHFFIDGGKKYSHTIDPRTGYPVQHNLLSATVIADDSCTADAISTACMVLGLEESKKFLVEKGLEGLLIYDENGEFRTWSTPGFKVSY